MEKENEKPVNREIVDRIRGGYDPTPENIESLLVAVAYLVEDQGGIMFGSYFPNNSNDGLIATQGDAESISALLAAAFSTEKYFGIFYGIIRKLVEHPETKRKLHDICLLVLLYYYDEKSPLELMKKLSSKEVVIKTHEQNKIKNIFTKEDDHG
ncbi:MAG: hypothetical protein JW885_02585 [Deltaproteobacteria bacterium]|nr:hypothetical protein [Candidatus Zymogenaceae bacterium]